MTLPLISQNAPWTYVVPADANGNVSGINSNPWFVDVTNVNANGQAIMNNSSPVVIASDQLENQANISNVFITEDFIRNSILAGKAFKVTTGFILTAATNALIGLQAEFNSIAKYVIIYRITSIVKASAAFAGLYQNPGSILTDAGLTVNILTSILPEGVNAGTSSAITALNTSPASTTQTTTSNAGTNVSNYAQANNSAFETLQNGSCIYIAKSTLATIATYVQVGTTGNVACINMHWLEL